MSKRCTPCISQEIKDLIGYRYPETKLVLAKVPTCVAPKKIELCEGNLHGRGKSGGKRAASAYNVFMSSCVKGKSSSLPITERFKLCAGEWKRQKGI